MFEMLLIALGVLIIDKTGFLLTPELESIIYDTGEGIKPQQNNSNGEEELSQPMTTNTKEKVVDKKQNIEPVTNNDTIDNDLDFEDIGAFASDLLKDAYH